jgi:hypothetical protein
MSFQENQTEFGIMMDLMNRLKQCNLDYEEEAKKSHNQSSKDFYEGVAFGYKCAKEIVENQLEVFQNNSK